MTFLLTVNSDLCWLSGARLKLLFIDISSHRFVMSLATSLFPASSRFSFLGFASYYVDVFTLWARHVHVYARLVRKSLTHRWPPLDSHSKQGNQYSLQIFQPPPPPTSRYTARVPFVVWGRQDIWSGSAVARGTCRAVTGYRMQLVHNSLIYVSTYICV